MKKSFPTLCFFFFAFSSLHSQFSYWVTDPQTWWGTPNATIEEALFTFEPKGAYTEVGMYLVFSAGEYTQVFDPAADLEVNYFFELPEKAMVTDSWLWVEEDIIRAKILDRWLASTIYENIVNRRRDPSLLIKQSATQYSLQIYPLPNGSSRKVKITALIPNEWTETEVFTSLAPEFVAYSPKVPALRLQVINPPGEEEPILASHPEATFRKVDDPEGRMVYEAVLRPEEIKEGNPIVLSTSPQWKSGVYMANFGNAEGGFYELGVLPASFFERETSVAAKKIMVLLQYNNNGPIDLPYADYLAAIEQALLKHLRPEDEFNIIPAGLAPRTVFGDWKYADEENIKEAIALLNSSTISSINLPGLIGAGVEAMKGESEKGLIVLFANSIAEGEPETANALLAEIDRLWEGTEPVPFFIADYTYPGNFPRYYLEPNVFYGNAYFYTNLARQTGGDWLEPDCCNRSFTQQCQAIFEHALDERIAMDLFTTLDTGFTFNRFELQGARGGTYNSRKPVFQYGRYVGHPPFTVEVAAFSGNQLYFNTINPELTAGDSAIAKIWHGFRMRELEKESDNRSITELISLSLEERILSLYTAFLCLEPSLGGEPCPSCQDRSLDGGIVSTNDQPLDTVVAASFAPNPFVDQISIRLDLGDGIDLGNCRLSVYDLSGREQYVFTDLPEGKVRSLDFKWDGKSRAGKELPAGMYWLHIRGESWQQSFAMLKQHN